MDPKLNPELAVVAGTKALVDDCVLLKLKPIPLAVVVAGFWMKETVLPSPPRLLGIGAIPDIDEAKPVPGATAVAGIAGFPPKLKAAFGGVLKPNDGFAAVINDEAVVTEVLDCNDVNVLELPNPLEIEFPPKLKLLCDFSGSLLPPSVNPPLKVGIVEAREAVSRGFTDVTGAAALKSVKLFALGVKLIKG